MHFTTSAAMLLLASYVSAAPVVVTQVVVQTVHVAPGTTQPTEAPKANKGGNDFKIAGQFDNAPVTTVKPATPTTTSVYVAPPVASTSSAAAPGNGNGNGNGNGDSYTNPGAGEKGVTVKFRTLDNKSRDIVFIPNNGESAWIANITVHPGKDYPYTVPYGWKGNYQALDAGSKYSKPGMLGEITSNGYAGAHYFDVSAEKNQREDWGSIKQLFPEKEQFPMSGCNTWPCNNVYICWNDEQTKSTHEETLIQTLGDGEGYKLSDSAYWAKDTRTKQQCDFRTLTWDKKWGINSFSL